MSLFFAAAILASSLTTPLNDLGNNEFAWGLYGGLWPNGSNSMPAAHIEVGQRHAAKITPRDASGRPSANGKIVFLAIGGQNTALTFERMKAMVGSTTRVAPSVVMLTASFPGVDAEKWALPWHGTYPRVKNSVLTPNGVTEQQVQAVWLQLSTDFPQPPLPIQNADAYVLKGWIAETARQLKDRYPNLEVAYLSSREYGGYSMTNQHPEPFGYETAFSVRWAILGQIEYMRTGFWWDTRTGNLDAETNSPWLTWGPYPWANGAEARQDGLAWYRDDFGPTGDVFSAKGADKSATLLLNFLMKEPSAAWFRGSGATVPSRSRAVRR